MKNFLNLAMHTARTPPDDPAAATITAVLSIHAGHICPPLNFYVPCVRTRPYSAWFSLGMCTSAVTTRPYRRAHRHIPRSGVMMVVPSCVNEYSAAMAFDFVTRLAIKPLDSRLRSVLVSMRCETLPTWRRNSPCRCGLSLSENKIFGVHLPIKIENE